MEHRLCKQATLAPPTPTPIAPAHHPARSTLWT